MPSKHSKNAGDRHYYSAHERSKNNIGSQHQRLGTDSQLPFGYCCLSLQPIKDAVITPSGHMYSREAMIAYLLTKTQELKEQTKLFELEQQKNARDADDAIEADRQSTINQFTSQLDGNSVSQSKRKATDERSNINDKNPQTMDARRRVIDDTTTEQKIAELRVVCPWVPQFTPNAAPAAVKAPPKRPASPCSGQPLRSKDLMPVNLVKESDAKARSDTGAVRFICPVSRDTITTQKVLFIKSTGVLVTESAAEASGVLKSKQCPITGKPFKSSDVLDIARSSTGFSASGAVEATHYRPSIN